VLNLEYIYFISQLFLATVLSNVTSSRFCRHQTMLLSTVPVFTHPLSAGQQWR